MFRERSFRDYLEKLKGFSTVYFKWLTAAKWGFATPLWSPMEALIRGYPNFLNRSNANTQPSKNSLHAKSSAERGFLRVLLPDDGARDHLFDHLSVSVYGVPCGSTDLPKSANRLSTGVHGGPWGTTGPYVT